MKKRNGFSQRTLVVLLSAMVPTALAFGQSQSQSSQSSQQTSQQSSSPAQSQPPKDESASDAAKQAQKVKPKPKKVYTEEDLSSMRGNGVSVVGDDAPASGAAGTKQADGKAQSALIPMSGRDEGYWRGKARPLLDQIAATEQQISKLKDDIKKYGAGGFDVTTGMKDNVAYIEDRNGQLKELEKRKSDLEKKVDLLEEEGRKAGADASWFR